MNKEDIRTIDQQAKDLSHEIQDRQLELVALQQKQITIAEYKAAVDEQLLAFAKTYENGEHKQDNWSKFELGNVTPRQAREMKKLLGFDVSNFVHVITSKTIRHIERRHGIHGEHDKSMHNFEDIARLKYVLNNFDTLKLSNEKSYEQKNSNNTASKKLIFSKRINGTMYVIEAVPDCKSQTATIVTMYIEKVQLHKETALDGTSSASCNEPWADVRNALKLSTANSISQSKENVNSKNKNKELEKE